MIYYFPSWLLSQAITVAYTFTAISGLSLNITTRNIVPWESEWFTASWRGDITTMKCLLEAGKAQVNDISEGLHMNALMVSLAHDNIGACQFLLQAGADMNFPAQGWGTAADMALQHSFVKGSTSKDGSQIQQYFQINQKIHNDDFELTELHIAVLGLQGKDLLQEIYNRNSKINAQDVNGRTALWWATRIRNRNAVCTLLEHGADPTIADRDGCTPVHNACASGVLPIVVLLLRSSVKNDPNVVTNFGWTPLHCAASSNLESGVQMLFDAGAFLEAHDYVGETPLLTAIRFKSSRALSCLLGLGANYISPRTKLGLSVLHLIAGWADSDTLKVLLNHGLKGVDAYSRSVRGESAVEVFERYKEDYDTERNRLFYLLWRKVSPSGDEEVVKLSQPAGDTRDSDSHSEVEAEGHDDQEVFFDARCF